MSHSTETGIKLPELEIGMLVTYIDPTTKTKYLGMVVEKFEKEAILLPPSAEHTVDTLINHIDSEFRNVTDSLCKSVIIQLYDINTIREESPKRYPGEVVYSETVKDRVFVDVSRNVFWRMFVQFFPYQFGDILLYNYTERYVLSKIEFLSTKYLPPIATNSKSKLLRKGDGYKVVFQPESKRRNLSPLVINTDKLSEVFKNFSYGEAGTKE